MNEDTIELRVAWSIGKAPRCLVIDKEPFPVPHLRLMPLMKPVHTWCLQNCFQKGFALLFTSPGARNRSEGRLIQAQPPLEGYRGGNLEEGWAHRGGMSPAGFLSLSDCLNSAQ